LEEVAARIKRGTTYREVLAALLLRASATSSRAQLDSNFTGAGRQFAHLASLLSDTDRWLPILWAIDQFKNSQARTPVKEAIGRCPRWMNPPCRESQGETGAYRCARNWMNPRGCGDCRDGPDRGASTFTKCCAVTVRGFS